MTPPKTAVLLTAEMFDRCFDPRDTARIFGITNLRTPETQDISEKTQLTRMSNAAIIITGWGTLPLSAAMLDAAPNLRLVCHSAGSVKHLLNPTFLERSIRVCSAAQALAIGVAEFAFGLMLVSMKGLWQFNGLIRQRQWNRKTHLDWVCEPYGATVGIIGASLVGREMIRLCRTLELAAILVYDPYLPEDEALALGATKVDLDELMRRSDVVSLHTPAVEETRHIIHAGNLCLLKDKALFVNTARGMCVDEQALIAELESGRIMACLDVTDPEPPDPSHPFYTLPNCILTPHIAGAIKQNTYRQGRLVADQIEAFLSSRPLPGEVDLTQLNRRA